MPDFGLWRRVKISAIFLILVIFHHGRLILADGDSEIVVSKAVTVRIHEGFPDKQSWEVELPPVAEQYEIPAFGIVCTPRKYNRDGLLDARPYPFVVIATARVELPEGEHRVVLRSKNGARLLVDGHSIVETAFLKPNASSHEEVPEPVASIDDRMTPLGPGQQEAVATYEADGKPHEFRLWAIVGGSKLRPEIGDVFVGVASGDEIPHLLSPREMTVLTPRNWTDYATQCVERQRISDLTARRQASAEAARYWAKRHEVAHRELASGAEVVPPSVRDMSVVNNHVDHFIQSRLEKAGVLPAELTDDAAFLRRVTLDTVGVIPSQEEMTEFAADPSNKRRTNWIARLLNDPRWGDHWVGYWQDVLAENPGILKPTLNNTGPFRWWILDSFRDNKPFDQFVTELIRMSGGQWAGGPAGFAMATQNDAPMAAKAHILAKAFLGIEMQCARCHDAPYHPFKQEQLFSLAAMLARKPQEVPVTSSVAVGERNRRPLIEVTLEPGVPVAPNWPFQELASADYPKGLQPASNDSREQLAAIITSPWNHRFAQVIVNRMWQRYLGTGLVEPVDDWHNSRPSHPELLDYLARELVLNGYDLKHIARLILESHAYQRTVIGVSSSSEGAVARLFASPSRRRMTAEQVVDSLFASVGKEIRAEELTMDPEGRRPITEMQNLGVPVRAWEFTSLSNERDRPALSFPVAQSVVDVLTAFGWRESRQNPITIRDDVSTAVQPMIIANGVVGTRIGRLSEDSLLTELAINESSPERLVVAYFRQILSRDPTAGELELFADLLRVGFQSRVVSGLPSTDATRRRQSTAVSWSNHLSPEATRIKLELEQAARQGDPPTNRLQSDWRERAEDVVWALINSPEFVFVP